MTKMENHLHTKFSAARLFYSLSTLLILTVLASSAIFLASEYFSFRAEVESATEKQNDRIKNRFLESLLQTQHVMERIATQISTDRLNRKPSDYEFIDDLLAGYRNSVNELISWSTFSWADKNYDLVVSSNVGIMKKPINMSHRDYMPLTKKYPMQIHLGKPVFGVVSKLWSIPVGYGVIDKHGNYLGSVISGMVIDGLQRYVAQAISDHNVAFAILDKNHEILTKSEDFDLEKTKSFFEKLKLNLGRKEFRYGNTFYQKVDGYPFGIVTSYEGDATFNATIRFAIYLIVVLVIALLSSFVFWLFYQNLFAPIFELSALAAKVSRGEKLPHSVPEFQIPEIEELAKIVRAADKKI